MILVSIGILDSLVVLGRATAKEGKLQMG